jgi:hypothetical protein
VLPAAAAAAVQHAASGVSLQSSMQKSRTSVTSCSVRTPYIPSCCWTCHITPPACRPCMLTALLLFAVQGGSAALRKWYHWPGCSFCPRCVEVGCGAAGTHTAAYSCCWLLHQRLLLLCRMHTMHSAAVAAQDNSSATLFSPTPTLCRFPPAPGQQSCCS